MITLQLQRSTVLADARAAVFARSRSRTSVVRVGATTGDTYKDKNGVVWIYDTDKVSPPWGAIRAYTNGYGGSDVYTSWYDRDIGGDSSELQAYIESYASVQSAAASTASDTTGGGGGGGGGGGDTSGGGGGGDVTRPGGAKPAPPSYVSKKPSTSTTTSKTSPAPTLVASSIGSGSSSDNSLVWAGIFALVAVGAIIFL